jgi:hypothetical protein
MRGIISGAAFAALFLACALAQADDRYIGYYYPKPAAVESYSPRAPRLAEASRKLRLAFVTGISAQQQEAPYPAQVAVFTKGDLDNQLILTALHDGPLDTLFRTRAYMAQLTAQSRLLPIFQNEQALSEDYTFFDLAYMMGFLSIVATNGRDFSYKVEFIPQQ